MHIPTSLSSCLLPVLTEYLKGMFVCVYLCTHTCLHISICALEGGAIAIQGIFFLTFKKQTLYRIVVVIEVPLGLYTH